MRCDAISKAGGHWTSEQASNGQWPSLTSDEGAARRDETRQDRGTLCAPPRLALLCPAPPGDAISGVQAYRVGRPTEIELQNCGGGEDGIRNCVRQDWQFEHRPPPPPPPSRERARQGYRRAGTEERKASTDRDADRGTSRGQCRRRRRRRIETSLRTPSRRCRRGARPPRLDHPLTGPHPHPHPHPHAQQGRTTHDSRCEAAHAHETPTRCVESR